MGFDPIQHALCEDNTKQEIKRQRLFGVDTHVFTYNGDKAGKQYIEFNGAYVVRVGSVIDPETVTEVLLVTSDGENLIEAPLPKDLISFDKAPLEELGLNGTMLIYDNNAWFACVIYESTDAVTAGTYVIDNMEGDGYKFYTSCIKAETIHPIDPKFIPGAVLPVVELSGTLTTGDAVAEEDCAKLKAAHGSNLPVVIKSDAIINNTRCADSALIYNSGTLPDNGVMFFVASLGTIQLQILSGDDGETWNAYAIS